MRRFIAGLAALAMPLAAVAQAPEPQPAAAPDVAIPGTCYVHTAKAAGPGRLIDRIELQEVQHRAADGTAIGDLRFHLGIQPKGGDDLIPSAVSVPCVRQGNALVCTLQCDGPDAKPHGRFRVEPVGKTGRKLTLETDIMLGACTPGETPTTFPKQITGKSFALRRAGTSDCFH